MVHCRFGDDLLAVVLPSGYCLLVEGRDQPAALALASAAEHWNATKPHSDYDNVILTFVEPRLPPYIREAVYDAVPTLPRYEVQDL